MKRWYLMLVFFLAMDLSGQDLGIEVSSFGSVVVSVPLLPGKGYRVERTFDFSEWETVSDLFAAPSSHAFDLSEDTNVFFRLRTLPIPDTAITLAMIGDSTLADFAVTNGQYTGWGQGMPQYFGNNIRVINLAVPGDSTVTFLDSSRGLALPNMKIIQPEFVLVQFGFLDQLSSVEEKRTTLEEYEANIENIVAIIREFGGSPILVTPVTQRLFGADGKIIPFLQDRCRIVREISERQKAYLIDLNKISESFFNDLGDDASAYISANSTDRFHFSLEGADVIAGLVVDHMPNILQYYRLNTE